MDKLNIKNNLVNNRESIRLEFKKTFQKTQKEYIRTICAFANNQGGKIIFGVEDKPRKPVGLNSRKYQDFNDYDSKELGVQIQNYLSENVDFKFSEFSQEINGINLIFGVLEVFESESKPIICTTSDEGKKLREGAVYYRYSGESKEIKSQDLIRLIQNEKEKEKRIFLDHIAKISKIGVKNVGVFSYDGELFAGDKKIIIDKDTIEKIKFIKEGKFVEKDGAPAIVLKGEIQNIESLEVVETQLDPNITHPFEGLKSVKNEILTRLDDSLLKVGGNGKKEYIEIGSLNKKFTITYLVQLIKGKLSLYNNIEYCWHSQTGSLVKYNDNFLNKCIEILKDDNKLNELLT